MAQGAQKLGKGKTQSRAKQMKSKQPKKGARTIAPKKLSARQAAVTSKKLTKQMSKSIEKEMTRRAGTVLPFKLIPTQADDTKSKSKGTKK